MRDAIAIVAPSVDLGQIERELQRDIIAMQDLDRDESLAAERASIASEFAANKAEEARRQRVEVGRRLIEAKKLIKHGEWMPWLARQGVSKDSASRWMQLAGFVDSKFRTDDDVRNIDAPTLADAGIDKRTRKSDSAPDPGLDEWTREVEKRRAAVNVAADSLVEDIGKLRDRANRWLSEVQDRGEALAASAPPDLRQQMAHELNDLARRIKEMK